MNLNRRVLRPFLFYTGSVNVVAAINLAPENALLNRMSNLDYKSMETALRMSYEDWKYQNLPDFIESKVEIFNSSNLNNDITSLPYWPKLNHTLKDTSLSSIFDPF